VKVFVTRPIPEAGLERLRAAGVTLDVNTEPGLPDHDRLARGLQGVQGVLSLLTEQIGAELMDVAPGLRVISNCAVGYNNIDLRAASERKIMVCNTPGVLTETTADFTWALLLAVARRVVEADRLSRSGEFDGWGPMMLLGYEVSGSTLGIVGLGRIGEAVARRAAGFGMRVLSTSRSRGVPLEQLLEEADFVTLHVPLDESTRHMISRPQLRRMKETACLINTARGPVVDEDALVEALREGWIAGAGLDVYEREPVIHPGLLELSNAVLAPHIASASRSTRERMASMAADNLVAALRGERPPYVVNPEVLEA